MLYFAFGSNMDCNQMRSRCPSARFVGRALLPEYELVFPRKSVKRKCGVASICASPNKSVWGVLFDLSDDDVIALDEQEGFRPGRAAELNSYNRQSFTVFVDGDFNRPMMGSTYVGVLQSDVPPPNKEYRELLVCGARFWNLPTDYIRRLETIAVAE